MIRSISMKEYPYVLESDRECPEDQQTVFHILPKTVRGATDTAVNYARIQKAGRRAGKTEIDKKAMQLAEDEEWCRIVQRVDRFIVDPAAPDNVFGHFDQKANSKPDEYVKQDDGSILIVSTDGDIDLKHISWSMDPNHVEEIIAASMNFNELSSAEKN